MSKEVRIGIIAVISGLILYYGFNFLKGSDVLSKNNYYFTVYNNVGSLATSNPVKINGVPVGRVTRIDLLQSQNDKVLVEFDVKENIIVGEGTVAELTSDLLGGTSIILRIGDITKPVSSGDTITSSVDKGLEEILESAQPVANSLNLVLSRMDSVLRDFKGLGSQLKETMMKVDTGVTRMNKSLAALPGVMENANATINDVRDRLAQLEPVLANADSLTASIDAEMIGETIEEFNQLAAELNTLMEGLNSGEGTVGKLLKDDSLYNSLNILLLDVDSLVNHFNSYPKDFLKPLGRKNGKLKGVPSDQ